MSKLHRHLTSRTKGSTEFFDPRDKAPPKGTHRAGKEVIMEAGDYAALREGVPRPKRLEDRKMSLLSVRLHPTKGYRVVKHRDPLAA